ncbi:MAG: hypothetical protein JNM78_07170 [Cyclobacteriaceae bacterium]|nr:hypothetical protein [Cyclobacteriaceae bacterium]
MKASEFYNERTLIETFGRSKVFETCRRMREVIPDFPQYEKEVTEFHSAWLIYLMSKTGRTTTKQAVYNAVMAGKRLKCGKETFIIWFGNLLSSPERINKEINSIWIYQDANCIQVNGGNKITVFQGEERVKTVRTAIQLSAQFLYDFAMKLNVKDTDSETVFESEEEDDEN